MKTFRTLLAVALALPFVLVSAGPTAAYQVLVENGLHGHYGLDDTYLVPGGTCKYGEIVYSNWAYLIWMKVKAPQVFAADRNSEMRDHRVVSWQFKLQRKRYEATTWKTIKSSAIQRMTAYEDQAAPFTALTINYDAENEDPSHDPNGPNIIFRALVIIKWYKPDNSVEGTVKLIPDYYKTKSYWNASPSSGYCTRYNTNG